MNRCTLLLCAMSLAASCALAQTGPISKNLTTTDGSVVAVRSFPSNALRGTLIVQSPPEVLLDTKADRLSPGARIRGANGMLALSATLVGQTLPVMYTREPNGMLHDVWILTELEAQLIPAKPSYSK
ncbi:hypothetical protein [Rhodoferax mekongensis]|uniref:Uncharacterized protein n=1 Tax=Rhodoferax mekongensis TaxID=3068341 RepID=A0ABZ0B1Z8_9BURK|nr:hypothetical protein [Rhodoferax sp. TBRC 17307]WNO05938.1 hypothetical protein RAN89_05785 [Rhodoferax sp. TBRC 17307]